MKKIILVLGLFLWASAAFASNADDISKNVNGLIRNAENAFFKGDADNAASILRQAEDGLGQLKAEDPAHRSLKTLQKKYDRLKARVDKKLGTDAPAAAAKPPAKPTGAPAATAAQDLSSGAKSKLKKADREMDFAERDLAKAEKSLADEKFNMVESQLYNANGKVESAGLLLDQVVNNNRADPDHPDVASAFQRHKALQAKVAAFGEMARGRQEGARQAAARAEDDEARITAAWLPKVTAFTEAGSETRLQYPGSYNPEALDRQERLYAEATGVLGELEKAVPADRQPHALQRAVDQLRFALQVYADEKTADNRNRLQPIETTLAGWETRFEQNKAWTETAKRGLFVIPQSKLDHLRRQIADLAVVAADRAAGFAARLNALDRDNKTWTDKKRAWMERPRPFPQAKMKSARLQDEMERLLEDRDITVKELAITDKDWWVQPGEFRYLTTAVLSADDLGAYWCDVSFRQIMTLTGYGPTEVWEIDEIRVRLPAP